MATNFRVKIAEIGINTVIRRDCEVSSPNTACMLVTSSSGGVGSIVMYMSVCLSVCSLEIHTAELHRYFLRVACGRGSVLLWRRCDE